MSQRWKYGSYEFRVNPNSSEQSIEIIGDNVRTLSGALIVQPTSMIENYSVSSIFYQPRSRVLASLYIPNCVGLEHFNGVLYSLNKASDRIDLYNRNFVLINSISLSGLSQKNYLSIDVVSSGIWILSDNVTDWTLYKIGFNGSLISTQTISIDIENEILGIQELDGYMFIQRIFKIEQYTLPSLTRIVTINLPFSISYSGFSSHGKYLLVGNHDGYANNVIYHIDYERGEVVNSIYDNSIPRFSDIAHDGKYFYTVNEGITTAQKIEGNTVLVDLYDLEKEIQNNKFVNMIDDFGTQKRVAVESISSQRRLGYDVVFDVSLKINKVNRG